MTDETILHTDRRSAILRATLGLVAERGFHNTPVSLVAERAGMSAGLLYHYFENKDALIHALYADIKQRLARALMANDMLAEPWPAHIKVLWKNAFWFYATHPEETRFIEQYENSPYVSAGQAEAAQAEYAPLYGLIEADVQAGYIRELPEAVLYDLTLGVALNLAKRQITGQLVADTALLDEMAAAVQRAIGK